MELLLVLEIPEILVLTSATNTDSTRMYILGTTTNHQHHSVWITTRQSQSGEQRMLSDIFCACSIMQQSHRIALLQLLQCSSAKAHRPTSNTLRTVLECNWMYQNSLCPKQIRMWLHLFGPIPKPKYQSYLQGMPSLNPKPQVPACPRHALDFWAVFFCADFAGAQWRYETFYL